MWLSEGRKSESEVRAGAKILKQNHILYIVGRKRRIYGNEKEKM